MMFRAKLSPFRAITIFVCAALASPFGSGGVAFAAGAGPAGAAPAAGGRAAVAAPAAASAGTTAPAAGAVVRSGSAVPVGAPAAAALGVGGYNGSGLSNTFTGAYVPGSLPLSSTMVNMGVNPLTPTAPSNLSIGLGATSLLCSMGSAGLATKSQADLMALNEFGKDLDDEHFKSLAKEEYAPGNHDTWRSLGANFNRELSGNCQQKFITKDGKLAQWGRYLYEEISAHPEPFLNRVPADLDRGPKYCEKFASFTDAGKARFYTYMMMTMADPESSCNPTARGKGPNGTAIGLFQLETPACSRVGLGSISASDLMQARPNMRCAVAVLASELSDRKTLTTDTSKGFGGTYWAPLRNDIGRRLASGNAMARADTVASTRFQKMVGEFSECKSGENLANNPEEESGRGRR